MNAHIWLNERHGTCDSYFLEMQAQAEPRTLSCRPYCFSGWKRSSSLRLEVPSHEVSPSMALTQRCATRPAFRSGSSKLTVSEPAGGSCTHEVPLTWKENCPPWETLKLPDWGMPTRAGVHVNGHEGDPGLGTGSLRSQNTDLRMSHLQLNLGLLPISRGKQRSHLKAVSFSFVSDDIWQVAESSPVI